MACYGRGGARRACLPLLRGRDVAQVQSKWLQLVQRADPGLCSAPRRAVPSCVLWPLPACCPPLSCSLLKMRGSLAPASPGASCCAHCPLTGLILPKEGPPVSCWACWALPCTPCSALLRCPAGWAHQMALLPDGTAKGGGVGGTGRGPARRRGRRSSVSVRSGQGMHSMQCGATRTCAACVGWLWPPQVRKRDQCRGVCIPLYEWPAGTRGTETSVPHRRLRPAAPSQPVTCVAVLVAAAAAVAALRVHRGGVGGIPVLVVLDDGHGDRQAHHSSHLCPLRQGGGGGGHARAVAGTGQWLGAGTQVPSQPE